MITLPGIGFFLEFIQVTAVIRVSIVADIKEPKKFLLLHSNLLILCELSAMFKYIKMRDNCQYSKIITLSGLDGSGKSTQIELLKDYLKSQDKTFFYFHAVEFSVGNICRRPTSTSE